MFKTAQEYITLIITRDFVQGALIEVSDKTAEIKLFAESMLEEGVIEDGVIYHLEGLEAGIKKCISQLEVRGKPKVWIAIPDNKIMISDSHSIDHFEKKFGVNLNEISILKTDNGITAVKKENLNGYVNAAQNAGLQVSGVYPIASCIQSTLKNVISGETLILYPFENSKLKFFIVNEKGVLLNSVKGLNTLIKNDDLEKGVKEIEGYAESEKLLKEINKVVIVSNDNNEDLSDFLPHYDLNYINKDQDEIENVAFLIIKGLIKKVNTGQKGFGVDDVVPERSAKTVVVAEPEEKKHSMKLGIIATILTLLVLVLIGILVYALVSSRKNSMDDGLSNVTSIPQVTATPIPSATPIPEPTPTPTPTSVPYDQLLVTVMNGNGIVGDSSKVQQFLISKGFKNVQKENASSFNHTTTEVLTKPNAIQAGDYIVSLLKDSYRSVIRKDAPATQKSDIVVILGAK